MIFPIQTFMSISCSTVCFAKLSDFCPLINLKQQLVVLVFSCILLGSCQFVILSIFLFLFVLSLSIFKNILNMHSFSIIYMSICLHVHNIHLRLYHLSISFFIFTFHPTKIVFDTVKYVNILFCESCFFIKQVSLLLGIYNILLYFYNS